jgi:hypothetical protein
MAKARTPRSDSGVTPINRKPSTRLKKGASQNGNLQEEIRRRAYELYEQRGGEHGRADEDWIRAEAELVGSSANRTA